MSMKTYFEDIGAWPRSHGMAGAYISGFVLSLALTLAAYLTAVQHALPQQAALIALMVLACMQFVVQVICFLHLGTEKASREKLVILACAGLIVVIIVVGSLWIMTHLNERMMADPAQMEQYMSEQGGI